MAALEFGRLMSAIFWTGLCQGVCTIVIWISATLELWLRTGGLCKGYNASSFVLGTVLCLASVQGILAAVKSRRCHGRWGSIMPEVKDHQFVWTCLVIYGTACTLSILIPVVSSPLQHCRNEPFLGTDGTLLSIVGLKLAASYLGLLASVLGLSFVCRQLLCPFSKGEPTSLAAGAPTATIVPTENNASLKQNEKRHSVKNQSQFQLPEAKTHVQECGGERMTVVTLTEADGVVYAVPEQSYVVRRTDGSYAAPTGNQKLTAFFPSYTRKQEE